MSRSSYIESIGITLTNEDYIRVIGKRNCKTDDDFMDFVDAYREAFEELSDKIDQTAKEIYQNNKTPITQK